MEIEIVLIKTIVYRLRKSFIDIETYYSLYVSIEEAVCLIKYYSYIGESVR